MSKQILEMWTFVFQSVVVMYTCHVIIVCFNCQLEDHGHDVCKHLTL